MNIDRLDPLVLTVNNIAATYDVSSIYVRDPDQNLIEISVVTQ